MKLRGTIISWVQEGFQTFFKQLNDQLLLLSGKNVSIAQDQSLAEKLQADKVPAGLVLVISELSVFIEQDAISRITEARTDLMSYFAYIFQARFSNFVFAIQEIGSSLSGGGYEYNPAFVPAEIRHTFRSAGEKFLQRVRLLYNISSRSYIFSCSVY